MSCLNCEHVNYNAACRRTLVCKIILACDRTNELRAGQGLSLIDARNHGPSSFCCECCAAGGNHRSPNTSHFQRLSFPLLQPKLVALIRQTDKECPSKSPTYLIPTHNYFAHVSELLLVAHLLVEGGPWGGCTNREGHPTVVQVLQQTQGPRHQQSICPPV